MTTTTIRYRGVDDDSMFSVGFVSQQDTRTLYYLLGVRMFLTKNFQKNFSRTMTMMLLLYKQIMKVDEMGEKEVCGGKRCHRSITVRVGEKLGGKLK
jgi:hypothetical protein